MPLLPDNSPNPPTPPSAPPPILPYTNQPDESAPRYGMPLWGQFVLGVISGIAFALSVAFGALHVGPLIVVLLVGAFPGLMYIHRGWKWPGFTIGVLLTIGVGILGLGICAVIVLG